jgi:hypothetical protein
MKTDKAKVIKYKKIFLIKWITFWSDGCEWEGWSPFIGDEFLSVPFLPKCCFSSVARCKIAIDLQSQCNSRINMLSVNPKNYNECYGKYISTADLKKFASRG